MVQRPLDAVAVNLSRAHTRQEHMPVVVSAVRRRIQPNHAGRQRIIRSIEEQEFHVRGCPREETEVDATVSDGGAQRSASADELGPDLYAHVRFTPEDE